MLNILIIGGSGFIGSRLTQRLLNKNKVTVIDNFAFSEDRGRKNLESLVLNPNSNFSFHHWDIGNLAQNRNILSEFDLIIYCVGLTNHLLGNKKPEFDRYYNLDLPLQFISECGPMLKGKKIIYLSSRGVYGKGISPTLNENTPCYPNDPQGINKLATEHYFRIGQKKYNYSCLSLRFANCYGTNQDVHLNPGLIGDFIAHALQKKRITIYGTLERKKEIIYVENLVTLIEKITSLDFASFEIFNLEGEVLSLKKFFDTLTKVIPNVELDLKPFPDEVRQIDCGDASLDGSRFRNWLYQNGINYNSLNFVDLEQSLQETTRYYQGELAYENREHSTSL